jgi:hypothetical protein
MASASRSATSWSRPNTYRGIQALLLWVGVPVLIDGHIWPASITAINRADPGSLMAELVSLSMAHNTVAAKEHASTDELDEAAAKRGV